MFDTEKFISEVEKRPPLYDTQSKEYSDREIKTQCWMDVAKAMYKEWNTYSKLMKDVKGKDMQKKWKAIRDTFMRDYKLQSVTDETGKPVKKKKKYMFYDQLLFLLPYVKGSVNTVSNTQLLPDYTVNDNTELGDIDSCMESEDESLSSTSSGAKQKKIPVKKTKEINKNMFEKSMALSAKNLNSILSQSLDLQKEERQADIYGHRSFMLSFVPILNSLPLPTAMHIRQKISDAMCSAYFEENVVCSPDFEKGGIYQC